MMLGGHIGRIVNVTSVAGLMGNIGQINYSAAKAGVVGLTKTVAMEWARWGVTCNAIAYGGVDTRFTREKEASEEVIGEKMGIPKKVRDVQVKQMEQMGLRFMAPEEAAKPVLFLSSEDAAFITGQVLNVTVGLYI